MLRPYLLSLLAAALSPATALAAPVAARGHELYVCISMAKGFIIGGKVQQRSGLYRIHNRETPEHLGFNHPRQDAFVVSPRDPKRFYTAGLNGVLGSTDGGVSWRILTSWDMTEPKDVALDPHVPEQLYTGLPDGIGVSTDGGKTWKRSNAGIARSYTQTIAVDRTQTGRVIAGTELGIYVSDDGAKSWRRVLPTRATVNDVRQSPHDANTWVAATQEDGAFRSRDGGATWQPLAGTPRGHTLHNLDFDATEPRRLVLCGWGCGVWTSEDDGVTWTSRGVGLPNADVMRVASDPDFPRRLYASPYQEAVFVSDDFGRSWRIGWFSGAVVWDFVFVPRS